MEDTSVRPERSSPDTVRNVGEPEVVSTGRTPSNAPQIKGSVVICNRQVLLAEALASVLSNHGYQARAVQSIMALEGCLDASDQCHVILIDVNVVHGDLVTVLRALKRIYGHVSIVVTSAVHEPRLAKMAFANGANGFLPKSVRFETLLNALDVVKKGGVYIPAEYDEDPLSMPDVMLSEHAITLLEHLESGKRAAEIAEVFGVSESSARTMIRTLKDSLQAETEAQAVANAIRQGLI